jgi:hypothetical protein
MLGVAVVGVMLEAARRLTETGKVASEVAVMEKYIQGVLLPQQEQ